MDICDNIVTEFLSQGLFDRAGYIVALGHVDQRIDFDMCVYYTGMSVAPCAQAVEVFYPFDRGYSPAGLVEFGLGQ